VFPQEDSTHCTCSGPAVMALHKGETHTLCASVPGVDLGLQTADNGLQLVISRGTARCENLGFKV